MSERKRSYGDVCGVARALDIVGERWTLMIARELLLGPKRFTDLRTGLPNLGPDVLSQRLRDMVADGLVVKRKLPPPAAAQVYELTDLGRRLEPVVLALGDFGAVLPLPAGCSMDMSFDAHLLSLRTLFQGEHARDMRVALRLDGGPIYRATIAGGSLVLEQGDLADPDVVIEGDPGELIAVAHGRLAREDSSLGISGDTALAENFLALFPLPEPAVVA